MITVKLRRFRPLVDGELPRPPISLLQSHVSTMAVVPLLSVTELTVSLLSLFSMFVLPPVSFMGSCPGVSVAARHGRYYEHVAVFRSLVLGRYFPSRGLTRELMLTLCLPLSDLLSF